MTFNQAAVDERLKDVAKARKGWRKGPWDHEPDRKEFKHAGLDCLLQRTPMGHWCGYVGVGREHPLHGASGSDRRTDELEVHGGITYARACNGVVCHKPAPGEPDALWWFGFDCAHFGDLSPGWKTGVYRDIDYVEQQTRHLAEQLAAKGKLA